FGEDYIKHNLKLVDELTAITARKGCMPGQLSIAWVGSLGAKVILLPGSSKKEHTLENLAGSDIVLTATDVSEINEAIVKHEVKGDRYFGSDEAAHLWG
ncbi:hypothetical protein C8Q72DRAFT_780159, partial [Fomitopsis betulina]